MDFNDMDILPSEEAIRQMNREFEARGYGQAFVRRHDGGEPCCGVERVHDVCGCGAAHGGDRNCDHGHVTPPYCRECGCPPASSAATLYKIYYLQRDILLALECLAGKSINCDTTKHIKNMIDLKVKAMREVQAEIGRMTCEIPYAPRMFCKGNFCQVLKEIFNLQMELQFLLNTECSPCLEKARNLEFACLPILTYLSLYCKK